MSRTTLNSSGLRTRLIPKLPFEMGDISLVDSTDDIGIVTPKLANGRSENSISHVRNLLEQKFSNEVQEVEDKSSPGLARLRMTPAGHFKQKQKLLMKKHEDARKQADKINVGGGVTLWPEMDDMRLHKWETIKLTGVCLVLFIITATIFFKLHGNLLKTMWHFDRALIEFGRSHPLDLSGKKEFKSSITLWHVDYRKLLAEIQDTFDMSRLTIAYQFYVLMYLSGVGVLLFFLLDNMFSTNKLSPRRIKAWVSLLTVIGTWTCLMCMLLVTAQHLENSVETNVLRLSDTLADLVETELEMTTFQTVLLYWRTRCLPPTTQGVLNILGLLPVRDVMYYLQYYSLPVIMALITPVVKLIMALISIYSVNNTV